MRVSLTSGRCGSVSTVATHASLATVSALLAVLSLVGCGGAPPPAAPEAAHEEAPPPEKKPALKMRSELGSVDPGAVKQAFSALDDKFMACQKRALDRVEVLSGNVKFFVRIGEDGAAKWTYLEGSEIGDRETEKCLLDTVMGARWPRPDGGDAEARYGMELPLQSTRPASDWSSDKVASALGKHGEAIDKCKEGTSSTFHATMYVGPGGKVLAAGVATSAKDGEEHADCLTGVLLKMKGLPSPGSWPAKVGFDL
jgi:hypothetical protein